MGKHRNNSWYFKKNYKAKFVISSILKKFDRDNLKKTKQKKTTKKGGEIMLETL
jgi:hypothetical protein